LVVVVECWIRVEADDSSIKTSFRAALDLTRNFFEETRQEDLFLAKSEESKTIES
jgi:hypothetical protein